MSLQDGQLIGQSETNGSEEGGAILWRSLLKRVSQCREQDRTWQLVSLETTFVRVELHPGVDSRPFEIQLTDEKWGFSPGSGLPRTEQFTTPELTSYEGRRAVYQMGKERGAETHATLTTSNEIKTRDRNEAHWNDTVIERQFHSIRDLPRDPNNIDLAALLNEPETSLRPIQYDATFLQDGLTAGKLHFRFGNLPSDQPQMEVSLSGNRGPVFELPGFDTKHNFQSVLSEFLSHTDTTGEKGVRSHTQEF